MRRAQPSASGSYRNLQALVGGGDGDGLEAGGPLLGIAGGGGGARGGLAAAASRGSMDSAGGDGRRQSRFIFVSNQLPLKMARSPDTGEWAFEWDEDALVAQAAEGIDGADVFYVGTLPAEVAPDEQDTVTLELATTHRCCPVFLGADLRERHYRRFCKQQLWPVLHYLLPLAPSSPGRFDPGLWASYVKANKAFADKLVEVISSDDDLVWVHDYHLLVLPSLLRKRLHRARVGLFLHSPFPSSEIFRTFPRREEILRSMLNADVVGFHTFDYARHFLSACSRMLGLEHVARRGSIALEYYGRSVGLKIMPTGISPPRFLTALAWPDTAWRAGELAAQLEGQTVLLGVDDLDAFKGVELKLLAVERLLDAHPEWRGRLTLVQVCHAPRGAVGRDARELADYIGAVVARVNAKYGAPAPPPPPPPTGGGAAPPPPPPYAPIVYLQRTAPLYERVALYAAADVVVVTATRDGMNLTPYEYVACRQGAADAAAARGAAAGAPPPRPTSTLVVSEFVGCSPSLSGAIRVNPWCVDAVADAMYAAVTLPPAEAALRHEKHWRYVSSHTVKFWAQSFAADLRRQTAGHAALKCYGLGLGLDSFRCVALTSDFRRLDPGPLAAAYARAERRLFLLDYDGTLNSADSVSAAPAPGTLAMLRGLCAEPRNTVYIVSGRARAELGAWFADVPGLGLAAEHGFFVRDAAPPGTPGAPTGPVPADAGWRALGDASEGAAWRGIVAPILQVYTESTDGSWVEEKETALVWHYAAADPDFGAWQAKELLDHLEGVLTTESAEAVAGAGIVEVKPRGVSKGGVAERLLSAAAAAGRAPGFVLCVGDDRSDEAMFASMEHAAFSPHVVADVFACTVGQKPSRAPFYVNEPADVAAALALLAGTPATAPGAGGGALSPRPARAGAASAMDM